MGLPRRSASGTTASRQGIEFDATRNAVTDLGMDPTGNEPIDDAFGRAYREGTLLEFPPGEYLVTETHRNFGDVDRFGIRGLGDGPRDVRFRPRVGDCRLFIDARRVAGHLIENVSFHERYDDSSGIHLTILSTDGSVVRSVEWLGRTPKEPVHAGATLDFDATTRDGVCLVEDVTIGVDAPAVPADYPEGVQGIRCSAAHVGEVVVRDATVHRRSSTALRCTTGHGVITVEGGEFVNNLNSSIRFGAGRHPTKTSSATGSYVRLDDDLPPTNDKIDAVRVNSSGLSDVAEVGAVFRDLTIECSLPETIAGRGVIAIPPFADHGRAEFYGCDVRNDSAAHFPTIRAAETTAADAAVVCCDCEFTGTGGGFIAEDRPDSIILTGRNGDEGRDSCIDMPNAEIRGFEYACVESGRIYDLILELYHEGDRLGSP